MRVSYENLPVLELEEKLISAITSNGWKVLEKDAHTSASKKMYTDYYLQGTAPNGLHPCVRLVVGYNPNNKSFALSFRPFKYWDKDNAESKAQGYGKCPFWWSVQLSDIFTVNVDIIYSPTRFMIFTEQNSKWVKQAYVGLFLPFLNPSEYQYPMLVTATSLGVDYYGYLDSFQYRVDESFMCLIDHRYSNNYRGYATFFNQEGFSANITSTGRGEWNYNNNRLTTIQSFERLELVDYTINPQNTTWETTHRNDMKYVQSKSLPYNGNVFGIPLYIVGNDKTSAGKVIGMMDGLYYPLCTVEHNSTTKMQDGNIYKNQKSGAETVYYSYIYDEVV